MAEETNNTSSENVETPPAGQTALTDEHGSSSPELTPEQVAAQEAHKESSKLGRRVSAMEQMIRDRDSKIEDLLYRVENIVNRPVPTPQYSDDGTDFVTKKDLAPLVVNAFQQYQTTAEREKYEGDRKYQIGYRQKLNQLGLDSDDPDFHAKVVAELEDEKSPFNTRLSNDAYADAERNYLKASLHLLKIEKPTNPFKGGKPTGAIGVGGDTKIKGKDAPMPKLSEEAAEYARSMGLTEDKIKEYLK